jgi:serine/threonine-protein kinase
MIHLRVLGTLEFKGGDARAVRAILSQPKRAAVLVYLALAQPRGFHSRDALLGLFWPESDAEHAHNALRQSIFALRRSLGADVFERRGGTDVGLDWSAITCDAEAFERHLDAGRGEDALELYRGDLLPSFFSAAPGFERWLESERSRLRRRAAAETLRLCTRAEAAGELSLAVHWARSYSTLLPEDEAAVSRLIALLQRMGERAEARRAYDRFHTFLREEFQLEPSQAIKALLSH